MEVSLNRGPPNLINHYKPSKFGVPPWLWKPPCPNRSLSIPDWKCPDLHLNFRILVCFRSDSDRWQSMKFYTEKEFSIHFGSLNSALKTHQSQWVDHHFSIGLSGGKWVHLPQPSANDRRVDRSHSEWFVAWHPGVGERRIEKNQKHPQPGWMIRRNVRASGKCDGCGRWGKPAVNIATENPILIDDDR